MSKKKPKSVKSRVMKRENENPPAEKPHGNAIQIDWVKLEHYASLKVPKKNIAWALGCSIRTLETKIRDRYDMTFTEYADNCMVDIKAEIVAMLLEAARGGNTAALIFAAKNYCGFTNNDTNVQINNNQTNAIQLNYKLDDDE